MFILTVFLRIWYFTHYVDNIILNFVYFKFLSLNLRDQKKKYELFGQSLRI